MGWWQMSHHPTNLRMSLPTRRFRRILLASLITLLTSALLLGWIGFIQWRGRQALQSDTHTTITKVGQQFIRALQSRRGTLTFIRDTLNRRPDLTLPQLQAIGASAAEHTRHLLTTGMVQATTLPAWWSNSPHLSRVELTQLSRAIVQYTQQPRAWRAPSTFVTTSRDQRPFLIMLEPLRASAYPQSAVVGVFDVKPLLEDFVTSTILSAQPVQILEESTLLYRTPTWPTTENHRRPIVVERPIRVDAARWTIQMQPGSTGVVRTLSWFNVLLVGLSIIADLGAMLIVWLLAARTWILQRAVARRTAALRRTSARLRQMAITDELTGLHNRRFFLDRWEWECSRAKRYQRPLACLMIDVNGFKQVNDRLGHQTGDLVLKQVAEELKTALRESDILARFGGDEFVIALPETTFEQATSVADKLRQISIPVPAGQGRVGPVRLSVGLSRVEQEDASPQEVLHAADESLYTFKRRMKRPLKTPAESTHATHSTTS